jgi:hypothetical protein
MENNKTEQWTYGLSLSGLFGRNRKVKSDYHTIAEAPLDNPLSSEALETIVKAKLEKLKVKHGVWHVTKDKETLENDCGVVIRSRVLHFGTDNRVMSGAI